MQFKLMMGEVEIGRSELDQLDDGMGVVTGDFMPSPAYAGVRSLFRRISDACEARDVPPDLWKERDSLALRVLAPDDTPIVTGSVMIYDFDIDGTYEIQVKLLDLPQWERLSRGRAR
jgi:hypothetical protein